MVVECYHLLDYETAKEGLERDANENFDLELAPMGDAPLRIDRNYKGNTMKVCSRRPGQPP